MNMSDPVIRVENLGKRYRLGQMEPYGTLRDAISRAVKGPIQTGEGVGRSPKKGGRNPDGHHHYIWALRNATFEVERGEAVGIIGPNGAGKTTLLKVLSRITEPTEGLAEIRGRVGSLLEVGTGFHPELTGKENIYLNGAILGMTKREIESKLDDIVTFAELEEFMETPVKRYSSGMYVRLAFAVAAHLEPEILLVDEILSVGDAAFQRKSLGKMEDVAEEGRTVLLVSHNMGTIRGLCGRAIWLNKGKVQVDGDAHNAVAEYLSSVSDGFDYEDESAPQDLVIRKVVLRDANGKPALHFGPGDALTVEVHYHAKHRIEQPHFAIAVTGGHGFIFGANMMLDGQRPRFIEGDGIVSCTFESVPLLPQQYVIRMGVRQRDGITLLRPTMDIAFFDIVGTMEDYGFRGEAADSFAWRFAPVVVPYKWTLPDGEVRSGG